jgi:hypothetical protein
MRVAGIAKAHHDASTLLEMQFDVGLLVVAAFGRRPEAGQSTISKGIDAAELRTQQ